MIRRSSIVLRVLNCQIFCFSSNGARQSSGKLKQNSDSSRSALNTNPVKGTRDVYPEDFRLRKWLFEKWENSAQLHGFEQYDAPIVESEDMYIRKGGEEISQQLYNFEDKSGRRLALRPEMTPSLARMVTARQNGMKLPIRWFSIPQCWRYEKMSKGRRREHYQWNMDIWGVSGIEAEADLLASAVHALKCLGLTHKQVVINVNSRLVLNDIMNTMGIPESTWAAVFVCLDKLDKMSQSDVIQELIQIEPLTVESAQILLKYIAIKDVSQLQHELGDRAGLSTGIADMIQLFKLADAYGITDWLQYDASVIRGLSYYTGMVFEGVDRKREFRAICGGGRYDTLLESFGGRPLPAVGFGFGDAVIMELLAAEKLLPDDRTLSIDSMASVLVYSASPLLYCKAVQVAGQLRAAGVRTDVVMEQARKPKWVFQHADRNGTEVVVMLNGGEGAAQDDLVVRDMVNGSQELCAPADVVTRVLALTSLNK